jgi:2-methylisocitrate lyase-like PEP mutase family enzyme
MPSQVDKANALRALHRPGQPLILVNVWDAAGAKVVAAQSGIAAIATASWSVSEANGYRDGGQLPLDKALEVARTVVSATDLPVTVDFEKGYADSPDQVKANVLRLIGTGAVGLNIEDSIGSEDGALWSIEDQVARVAAVRAAGEESGVPLVINARTDVLIGGGSVDDAIERGRAYLAAGADCIFVIGQAGSDNATLVEGIGGPVSVMGGFGSPSIAELAAAGVSRVSLGPGSMGVAYAALRQLTRDLLGGAPFPEDLGYRLQTSL